MPATRPTHDESARLDFVEGVRTHNYRRLVRPLIEEYPDRVGVLRSAGGTEPRSKEEVGRLYETDPRFLIACAVQRSMQKLAWRTAAASVERHREELTDELRASAASEQHSGLELDPTLELPDWYTQMDRVGGDDIHLVPGGYWGNELIGAVYDRGGAAYRLAWRAGYDARPGALDAFVAASPEGDYRRVLDLGCSFGGLTRALRSRFADAEVVGIDLSAPALTHAHRLAESAGQAITYSQRDAQATRYDDASFDWVGGFLLLHEVPDEVRARIITEAFRVLRPGGTLMFLDIPPYAALRPEQAYFESFDGRGNGETFWEEFLSSDFKALLASTGFVDVEDHALDFDDPGYWGSSALWRTGEFEAVHRWVTTARKPDHKPARNPARNPARGAHDDQ